MPIAPAMAMPAAIICSASSHKADKAKPRRALLQSIEYVLEHALAGMSKKKRLSRKNANEN